ncbi:MAG: sialidase family protein, partial [bacterium]
RQSLFMASEVGIHISGDNGASWRMAEFSSAHRITFADEEEDIVLVCADEGLAVISRDGGQTWERQRGEGGPFTGYIVADPTHPGLVYGAAVSNIQYGGEYPGGLYVSQDYAKTWTKDPASIGDCTKLDLIRLQDGSGDTLLLVTAESGTYIRVNDRPLKQIHRFQYTQFARSQADPLNILATQGPSLRWISLLKTEDGDYVVDGDPKFFFPYVKGIGLFFRDINDVHMFDDDPNHILFATNGGICESFDHGETFELDESIANVKRLLYTSPLQGKRGKYAVKTSISSGELIVVTDQGAYRRQQDPSGVGIWRNY